MIRQAINCDMCGAEKQESNYWFVAYEQGGELKLRGWESPQNSRKNAKHLCGQKCAQRMMANFMASLTAASHVGEVVKEVASDNGDRTAKNDDMELIGRPDRAERSERSLDRTDRSLVGRANVESADIDAESWAGPVRFKSEAWEAPAKPQAERENFLHAPRIKPSALNRLQRMV
jgi:hypothetical protein